MLGCLPLTPIWFPTTILDAAPLLPTPLSLVPRFLPLLLPLRLSLPPLVSLHLLEAEVISHGRLLLLPPPSPIRFSQRLPARLSPRTKWFHRRRFSLPALTFPHLLPVPPVPLSLAVNPLPLPPELCPGPSVSSRLVIVLCTRVAIFWQNSFHDIHIPTCISESAFWRDISWKVHTGSWIYFDFPLLSCCRFWKLGTCSSSPIAWYSTTNELSAEFGYGTASQRRSNSLSPTSRRDRISTEMATSWVRQICQKGTQLRTRRCRLQGEATLNEKKVTITHCQRSIFLERLYCGFGLYLSTTSFCIFLYDFIWFVSFDDSYGLCPSETSFGFLFRFHFLTILFHQTISYNDFFP